MKTFLKLSVFVILCIVLASSCRKETEQSIDPPQPLPYLLVMKWNPSYPAETKSQVETGLKWAFSFLGATLPQGTFAEATRWHGNHLIVQLDKLGFNDAALLALAKLAFAIRASEEYRITGSIDIGRFVMLTINSTNHYYAITGVSRSLAAFRNNVTFDTKRAAVIESSVSKSHRLIELPASSQVSGFRFVASEGSGSIPASTFAPSEFEVFDIMPNGQLRFAMYDMEGNLKVNADTNLTHASKPARCLWCHEINILPPFLAQTDVPGYYTQNEFRNIVDGKKNALAQMQVTRQSDIDFTRKQDHTQTELLYIGFMEPNAERLASEWGMSSADVQQKLAALPTHHHAEFPYLGILYDRKDVEAFAPVKALRVPDSARLYSAYEPDLIH